MFFLRGEIRGQEAAGKVDTLKSGSSSRKQFLVAMEDLSRRKRKVVEVKAKVERRIEATTPTSIKENMLLIYF